MATEGISISSDTKKLDPVFIHAFISKTYWAKNRSLDEVRTCIAHSVNFGVYLYNEQIGYARVVTDHCVFAYLMDVFIAERHRNKGYSSLLMSHIMEDADLKHIKVWRLATTDTHFLYKKFGFKPIAHLEKMMEKITGS